MYAHCFEGFLELDKHSNTQYLKLVPELIKSSAVRTLAGWSAGAAGGEGRVPPAFPLIEGMIFFSTKLPVFTKFVEALSYL